MNAIRISMAVLYLVAARQIYCSRLFNMLRGLTLYLLVTGLLNIWWDPESSYWHLYWTMAALAKFIFLMAASMEWFLLATERMSTRERTYLFQYGVAIWSFLTIAGVSLTLKTENWAVTISQWNQFYQLFALCVGVVVIMYKSERPVISSLVSQTHGRIFLPYLVVLFIASTTGRHGLLWYAFDWTSINYEIMYYASVIASSVCIISWIMMAREFTLPAIARSSSVVRYFRA